jgi:hypothetical protein
MIGGHDILGPDGLRPWYQWRSEPSVYLDTCGMRVLAHNRALAERFVAALRSSGGTWAVSLHNVVEFRSAENRPHASIVADLVDRVPWHLFFVEWHHERVILSEKYGIGANKTWAADGDVGQLTQAHSLCEGAGFTVGGLWRLMQMDDAMAGAMVPLLAALPDRIRQSIASSLQHMTGWKDRAKVAGITNMRAHILRAIRAKADRPRATDALRQAAQYLFLNHTNNKPNDVLDMGHAIVQTAYCDLVVLDKKWCAIMNQASRWVRESGSKAPLARLFPPNADGLEQFVSALEGYVKREAPAA